MQQRGLAGAVGSDDADFVAAADDQREGAHQRLTIVAEFEVADFDHQIARALSFLHTQSGDALALAPFAALIAHLLQCASTAFVAGAAGLDALANPYLFLGDLAVEDGAPGGLGLEPLVAQVQEFIVIAGKGENLSAVELDDAGGQFAQQCAVVGDEDQGATPAQQEFLEIGD